MTITITLPMKISKVLAGEPGSADGRIVDDLRRQARGLAEQAARKHMKRERTNVAPSVEIYACARHGGCLLDVIDLPAGFGD